ncbi:hypothetical protein J3R82DRAFT_8132 [Butyriboletus roseoflavus]|nr:hypothetical protein J3R82DRAFT_8132 [Butyriboletus roseoflavus]
MGANHSQPKDHKEERKVKRSPTLPSLLGKTSSRLNLLGLGRRSPQPPATPVTPQAATVLELVAEGGMASPEASVADPENRPEVAVDVSPTRLLTLSGLGLIARPAVAGCTPDINTRLTSSLPLTFSSHPQQSGPRIRRRDRHAPTTRDGCLPGRTLGSGTYAIVKEAIHIKTEQYYACKVINKKLMEGREHMASTSTASHLCCAIYS